MNLFSIYQKKIFNSLKSLEKKRVIKIPSNFKNFKIESPPKDQKADISVNAAMLLAKINTSAPFNLAKIIKKHLLSEFKEFESIDIAGPGFLNIKFNRAFWKNYLNQVIKMNFKFGSNRSGDINLLKKINIEKNFYLHIVDFVKSNISNEVFSSSAIRRNIKNGNVNNVCKLLGRPWTIKGIVEEGDKRARQMNFPTANILSPDTIHPKKGVYAVQVIFDGQNYSGIANFGRRPTFGGKKVLLEVNIFGFDKEIYGKELTVEFLTFIREELKFENFDKLKEQVNKDVQSAKSFFINSK